MISHESDNSSDTWSPDDYRIMARALQLARRGLYSTDPNPHVGCVIVRENSILGEGWHVRAGDAHAEINALRKVGDQARGATCYVTLEPCCHQGRTGPCTEALIQAGIERVVVAARDPNPRVSGGGVEKLREAGIRVDQGLLASESAELNAGFFHRMNVGRPLVRCKLGMSLDGRTAMASGESKWITSAAARRDVQRLRARSSAIMTGIGTVLADNPAMTVRDKAFNTHGRQPMRVVLDSSLRMSSEAAMLSLPGRTIIVTASDDQRKQERLAGAGAEVIQVAASKDGVELAAVMPSLADLELNEILLEAGPKLAGAMMACGLVDELVLYVAPLLLGHEARTLINLPDLVRLEDGIGLDVVDMRAIGPDWRITARVNAKNRKNGAGQNVYGNR